MRQKSYPRQEAKHAGRRATANGAALQPQPPGPTLGPPLAELHFEGVEGAYRRVTMCAEERARYDRHLELWDRATQTALEVREVSAHHEWPSQTLAGLLERVAQLRGKRIQCFGNTSLHLLGKDGLTERMMEPDQMVYLHPERVHPLAFSQRMVVGSTACPDVVLEVDHTTDVRRSKLKLYEAWRFPELWVEVPDASPRPTKWHGLTIHVLKDGVYQESPVSEALPSWAAADIHVALNEEELSQRTNAALQRVGAALGACEGTGPDDDPMLRAQRRDAFEKGHRAALSEARTAELEHRAVLVRTVMAARGLHPPANFPLDVDGFAEAGVESVADAAARCANVADFRARLRRSG